MEPEKIISEKILLEELTPVRWQKDLVWQNIPRENKSRRPAMYSVAASLVLAAMLIIYFLQIKMDQQVLKEITFLESKIIGFNTETSIDSMAVGPATEEECEEVDTPEQLINRDKNRPELAKVSTTEVIPFTTEEEIPQIDSTSVVNLETEPSEELPVIEAVIGVVPAHGPPLRTAKVKKIQRMHFNFSREQKDSFSADHEKHSLTARIN